jgi:hypothetical protein
MYQAGDFVECVMAAYSEGKLLEGGFYEVERSWDCGGSEFLDLVGNPGPFAPERFKRASRRPEAYTTAWPYDGTVLTYTNASATTVTLPDDTSHFPIGTTLTYDGTTLTFVNPEDAQHFEKGATVAVADETARRKAMPVCSGVLDYFPDALLAVSQLSKLGNDKYNPGEKLHWARGKSMDHADALVRHHMQRGTIDTDTGLSHTVGVAWRALAQLQEELEAAGAPMARGAKVAK